MGRLYLNRVPKAILITVTTIPAMKDIVNKPVYENILVLKIFMILFEVNKDMTNINKHIIRKPWNKSLPIFIFFIILPQNIGAANIDMENII